MVGSFWSISMVAVSLNEERMCMFGLPLNVIFSA